MPRTPWPSQLTSGQFRKLATKHDRCDTASVREGPETELLKARENSGSSDDLISAIAASVLLHGAVAPSQNWDARRRRREKSSIAWGAQIEVIRRRSKTFT